MPEHRITLRVTLISVVMVIAFGGLMIVTWQLVSPASSPLNAILTAEPWPAVPRPSRPLTLDPAQFEGRFAEAYRIAKERPELLERVACYCDCYLTAGHQNALDCFRDRHGATCETCAAIAIRAEELAKRGYSAEDVKALLDRQFSKKKPT